MNMGKIRPQIAVVMVLLGGLAYVGIDAGFNEIASGCLAGLTALGMKILEQE